MNHAAASRKSPVSVLSLIWAVPILTLMVGGWMIYHDLLDKGPEITIDFADGQGIEAERTVLEYKGVSVGTVTGVELKKDLSGVTVRVRLEKTALGIAKSGAEFWIVRPEVSLTGIRGLETLVTGVRLNVMPGLGAPATTFTGLEQAPAVESVIGGRTFILASDRLGALTPGASVYYREMKVGVAESNRLADDSTAVLVRIRIFTPYAALVRTNTQFRNTGGLSLNVGLFGAEMKNTSIESLINGSISFATPDGELAPEAQEGAQFQISSGGDSAWLKWQPKIPLQPTEAAPK
jgi:paraquat-inducible protein B